MTPYYPPYKLTRQSRQSEFAIVHAPIPYTTQNIKDLMTQRNQLNRQFKFSRDVEIGHCTKTQDNQSKLP